MKIKDVRERIFPFLGIQPTKWRGKGMEISAAWSDGYKQAYKEVYEHLERLEKEGNEKS